MTDTRAMPLIDAHHHIWDLGRNHHPWLCESLAIPFRYGDYSSLRRNYLLDDFRDDAADFDLVGSVYVEAEWNPDDPLGEMRWLAGVRERADFPIAAVGQAWLEHGSAEETLAAHRSFGFVRSVRQKPTVQHAPYAPAPGPCGSMSDPRWQRGFALLEGFGLHFDLQVVWWHLPEAARLARDFPNITIILNHTGLPADRSDAGLAAWRRAMDTLAAQPNVALKISGLGTCGEPWSVSQVRVVVRDAIAIFGVERCMFASNFPVDRLVGGYRTIMGGFMDIVADRPDADRRKLFHDNAARYYSF